METQFGKNVFYINKKFFYLLVIFIITIFSLFSYFYIQYKDKQKLLKKPAVSQEEAGKIVALVESLMQLPKNENPTIATVSNKEKLKDQPFFNNAQNGDKVLIYTKAKKAILYRPSINKIIEVSFLNFGATSAPIATPASELSPTPTIPQGPNSRQ